MRAAGKAGVLRTRERYAAAVPDPGRNITVRIVRPGQAEPKDFDWQQMSVEQRIAAVWELTKTLLRLEPQRPGALRLQRSVVHIQRRWR